MNDEQRFEAVLEILRNTPEYETNHHLGRPFLSAYQIAIRFAEAHAEDEDVQNLEIGGAGIGENNSLAKSLARFLSMQIRNGERRIEGGFISHDNLNEMTFSGGIAVSTLNSKPAHSIFRCVIDENV